MDIEGQSFRGPDRPLRRARVDLLDGAGRRVASTLTTSSGHWRFSEVPDGAYSVRIEDSGIVQVLRRVTVTGRE